MHTNLEEEEEKHPFGHIYKLETNPEIHFLP